MDREALSAFQGFSDSLLDASDIARENREASLRVSGNLPWNRCALCLLRYSYLTTLGPARLCRAL